MTLEEVKVILNKIEEAKLKRASLQGKIESLFTQLSSFGIKNLPDAEAYLADLSKEVSDIEATIAEKEKALRNKYPQLF